MASAADRSSGSSSWSCQPARKTSSRAGRARSTLDGCSPSHSPGVAADEDQRGAAIEALARPRVGAHQQAHALDLGEAPDADEHGAVGQRSDVGVGVGDAAGLLARAASRAARSTSCAAPERGAVDRRAA